MTTDAKDQLKGAGYRSNVSGFEVILDALHVNLGSGENFRHLNHGSEKSGGSRVWKLTNTRNVYREVLKLLEADRELRYNMQFTDRKKFNNYVTDYMENTTKENVDKLADAVNS